MTRLQLIRRILRQVYGGLPSVDSNITDNLVNNWLSDALALAAKKNYTDNLQIDQIAYVNNSFYTTFSGLAITPTGEQFMYQLQLPQIPVGIGENKGVGTLEFVDPSGSVSDPAILLSENQVTFYKNMRPIGNKIIAFPEGIFMYMRTTLQLFNYTGKARMISGGDSTNLGSIINIPDDYFPTMVEYIKGQLAWERAQPKIATNDGADA